MSSFFSDENYVDSSPAADAVSADLGHASESPPDRVEARSLDMQVQMAQRSRSWHNSRLPVSLLPAELLLCIFFELRKVAHPICHLSDWIAHLDGWLLVTHVCSGWRSIAIACTSLWTRIPLSVGQRWAEEFVARSKTAALEIPFMRGFSATSWPHTLIRAQLPRIVNFELLTASATDIVSFLDLMNTHTLNQLVKLRLFLDPQLDNDITLCNKHAEILHQAPQLRYIALSGISLSWGMLPWSKLQTLSIVIPEIDNSNMSDLSLLVASLISAAALENLDLDTTACHFHAFATSPFTIANLPRLRYFGFEGFAADFSQLLDMIRMPTTTSLVIDLYPDSRSKAEPSVVSKLLRAHTDHEESKLHGRVKALQLKSDHAQDIVTVQIWQTKINLEMSPKPRAFIHVSLHIAGKYATPSHSGTLQALCKAIKLDSLCQLRLSLFAVEFDNGWNSDTWHHLFSSARNVESVRFDGPWIRPIFQALLFQAENAPSEATPEIIKLTHRRLRQTCSLFPSLSHISLVGFESTPSFAFQFDSLSAWVQRRARHAPIKMLLIRNSRIERNEIEKLRAIEGLEVDWDGRRRCVVRREDSDNEDDDDDECTVCNGYGCPTCVGSDFDTNIRYSSDFHCYD